MDIDQVIRNAGPERTARALATFLEAYTNPAFGTLPKSETELLVLGLLTDLGAVKRAPTAYELMAGLKVTRSKARRLLYDRDLRRQTTADLDGAVRALLTSAKLSRSGDLFSIDVDNPLLAEHLRARVVELGHVPDGSFSPSVVRLPLRAFAALMEFSLPPEEHAAVREALVKAGAPDTSLGGVLTAVLTRLGERVADRAGGALVAGAAEFLTPILAAQVDSIQAAVKPLFFRGAP